MGDYLASCKIWAASPWPMWKVKCRPITLSLPIFVQKSAAMSSLEPRLDRTKFKLQSLDEANHQLTYWLSKTPAERLQAAWWLTCRAYGFDPAYPPRLDRTVFSARKQAL